MASASMSLGGVASQESLTSALTSKILPDQEYFLQGSILDSHLENLQHRLRGLCDGGDEMAFAEKEMVFVLRSASQQQLTLRVRKPLTDDQDPNVPWQLRYLGQIQDLRQESTFIRSCYDIACGNNVVEFLSEMGCRLDFEFVAKGFMYRKGRMKVIISKIHKIVHGSMPNAGETHEPMTGSHLVELSLICPAVNDAVADDMKSFADQLRPLVTLDKIVPRRPQ